MKKNGGNGSRPTGTLTPLVQQDEFRRLELALAEAEEHARSYLASKFGIDVDVETALRSLQLHTGTRRRSSVVGHRRRTRVKRGTARNNAHVSLKRELQAPIQVMQEDRAKAALAYALSLHQPVVRECVVRRLLDKWSYEQLATELDLTRQQVRDILARLRRWVARFTDYFEDDSYWADRRRARTRAQV